MYEEICVQIKRRSEGDKKVSWTLVTSCWCSRISRYRPSPVLSMLKADITLDPTFVRLIARYDSEWNVYVRGHVLRRRAHASWMGGLAEFLRWSVRRAVRV